MSKKKSYETVGELFCGPGGGGIGSSLANFENDKIKVGIRHLWATDIDPDSCKTYEKNITRYESEQLGINEKVDVKIADVNDKTIDLTDANQFPYVDGLLFGFPCNDFSIVGESKGLSGKFGPLYKHGIKVLNRDDKPKWFLAENVGGLSSANEGKAFKQIVKEMIEAGYTITAHKYKFEEYGIPQARHRIIIVGFRNDSKLCFKVPAPSMQLTSVKEALSDIPTDATHQELTKQSKTVIERLQHIKPGENAWNSNLPSHLKLNVEKTKLSHIYKRLDPDKPSYTVTGSGGGGTHMYHWAEPRALTNRERARIQTFPDWFEFVGSKESIRKQIGMAIPPEGIRMVCNAILDTIYKKEYDSVKANIKIDKR
ncbi:DNA (cytosine-5-)-methyltransferase [Alphaproteobacteria bacterium]|nr:DNA (cytosine-5-)-methyltransferase [Alphaproteobacteria bacterium]